MSASLSRWWVTASVAMALVGLGCEGSSGGDESSASGAGGASAANGGGAGTTSSRGGAPNVAGTTSHTGGLGAGAGGLGVGAGGLGVGAGGLGAGGGIAGGGMTAGGAAALGGSGGGPGGGAPSQAGAAGAPAAGGASSQAGQGGAAGAAGLAGSGGASAVAGSTSGGAASGGTGGSPLPPVTDYTKAGPFTTTVDKATGPNGGYTVFRPSTLGEDDFLHAPIVFGPGIGQQVTVHTGMLTNFASHGFVVVGTPVLSGGPGDAGNLASMRNGLEWIIEQNSAPGIYQGKLDVRRAVSMGFSVGGTAAVQLGGHEAVATVVSIHGHTASAELHGPMLQTTGTRDTVGMPLQQRTYDMSNTATFLATLTDAPHAYIESNGGGVQRPAILAWMRYWIYNDTGAQRYFFGDQCVLCTSPWENPRRKNWPTN